jgi:uncharacterized protein
MPFSKTRLTSFSVGLALAAAPIGMRAQQRDALILLTGNDTVAIERFSRTRDRLESEVLFKAQGIRFTFAATLRPNASVSRLENDYRPVGADRSAAPMQSAVFTFTADSAIVDVSTGGRTVTQRLKSAPDVVPFINPSFSLIELVVLRARGLGGDSVTVPAFAVAGGAILPIGVTKRGADSVVVSIGGLQAHLAVNAKAEIVGGAVPAQGLRIVRVRNVADAAMKTAPPDYSAPPGAPYTAEEVKVPTPAGFTLAGTLTLPKGAKGPLPAFVTITGSGLEDRDEAIPTVSGYRPFRQIADTLSRHGVAVLRLDDRGYGGSGGDPTRATSVDFADDIRAGLAFLRSRKEFDAKRLGLIGHSEGGLIAPLIAAEDSSLRGIIVMAGPSWSGRRVIEYQNRFAVEMAQNLTAAQRDSMLKVSMHSVDSIAAGTPWIKYFLDYDPLPAARRVRMPVLILQGATDRQVTAEQAEELGSAIRAGGNRDVTVQVFPNADHLFANDPDGNPTAYARLPVHAVRSDVLAAIVDWVSKHF